MPIDIPRLPVAFMNDDHAHAASLIETMKAVSAAYAYNREPLAIACREFIRHNREHFAREEAAMQATGFPPFAVHKAEHDRVLNWLDTLAENIDAGLDIESISRMIDNDIPTWFIQHVRSMDNATAAWVATHERASSMSI